MMNKYGLFGIAILSSVFALPARAEVAPRVFISEINWAGSQTSTADEWIELVNVGTTPVDLSHWMLTGSATSGGAIEIAEGTVLQPQDTLLIANYALGDPKTTLTTEPDLVTTAISLPNSALNILLTTPDGLVIDSYSDSGTPDFGSTTPPTSIARDLTTFSWMSSTQNLGLSNPLQLGTPGSIASLAVSEPEAETETANSLIELGHVDLPPEPVIDPQVQPTPDEPEPVVEPVDEQPSAPPSLPIHGEEARVEPASEAIAQPAIDEPDPALDVLTPSPDLEPMVNTEITPDVHVEPIELSVTTEEIVEQEIEPISAPEPLIVDLPVTDLEPLSSDPTTSVVQNIAPGDLLINELVSDPIDSIEWIELLNTSSATIDLSGFTLVDAGDHTTSLSGSIAAGEFLLIQNPVGKLNNTGDTVSLFDQDGALLDTIIYGTADVPAPEDGESLARTSDGAWQIAIASPATTNVFPTIIEEQTETTINLETNADTSATIYETITNTAPTPVDNSGTTTGPVATPNHTQSSGSESVHRVVAIAKSVKAPAAKAAASKKSSSKTKTTSTQSSQKTITGTVVALPGTFGKQTLFLDGYEIYFHAAEWPQLSIGDIVKITGTPSTLESHTRLKVSSANDIVVLDHSDIVGLPIDGSEFDSLPHGTLVSVAGLIEGRSGDTLMLRTGDGTLLAVVAHNKTGVSWSSIQSGTAIITGIIRVSDDGPRLFVRSSEDITITSEATDASPNADKSELSKGSTTTPLVGGGLLTGSVGALGTWYVRSRKNLLSFLS